MSAIIEKIKQEIAESTYWEDDAGDWDNIVGELECSDPFDLKDGSKVTTEDSWGGEGEGDSIGYVLKIERPGGEVQHLRVVGYYASWDGADWGDADIALVEPYEKVITDYRVIKAN